MRCFMTNQDCIFEKRIQEHWDNKKKKSLFVVSPFNYPYDEMYTNIIRPAAEAADIEPQRADRAFQLGFVMCTKICRLMQEADYVVADLTEDNANVYYELGMAWGFGKKVVLVGDNDVKRTQTFKEIFGKGQDVVSYKELLELETQTEPEKAKNLMGFLDGRCINVETQYEMEVNRSQGAYILKKNICFCYRDGLADAKFYLREIEKAAKDRGEQSSDLEIQTESWDVKKMPVAMGLLCGSLPKKFSSSKVIVVDVTHYNNQEDTSIYFALGLSHAIGRETIPITNRAKCRNISPFDVRGLWQVYFDKLEELKTELVGILHVIDRDYKTERNDYPLRFLWDEVLKHPARLSVFTCARGASWDADRVGGRTNVDKWDYEAVARLALFLAQKYKQAEMKIMPPEDKETNKIETNEGKNALEASITKKIKGAHNSVIIIGSPDVSDYAEVVLSKIYGVDPYNPEKCNRDVNDQNRRCWDCNADTVCVGKRGYLFYKNTKATKHPRELSSFFRKPPKGVNECVLWYKERFECEDRLEGDGVKGTTFGVLTLLKDRDNLFAPGKANRWIILLSGFTGVATYGLAKLLTSLDVKTDRDKSLQETLKEKKIDLEDNGVQVLLSVKYRSSNKEKNRDPREPTQVTILDAQPLFRNCAK